MDGSIEEMLDLYGFVRCGKNCVLAFLGFLFLFSQFRIF